MPRRLLILILPLVVSACQGIEGLPNDSDSAVSSPAKSSIAKDLAHIYVTEKGNGPFEMVLKGEPPAFVESVRQALQAEVQTKNTKPTEPKVLPAEPASVLLFSNHGQAYARMSFGKTTLTRSYQLAGDSAQPIGAAGVFKWESEK